MKAPKLLTIIFMLAGVNINTAYASEHHSGHGGSSSAVGGSGNACSKPQLTKFTPAHLETATRGSAFSFLAFNVEKPEQIEVTVKSIPVTLTTEDKETFYIVKGMLPSELHDTIARINIKVNAKISRCEGENGWLVKITD